MKSIIEMRIYDTEKAEYIGKYKYSGYKGRGAEKLYKTKKGNYFFLKTSSDGNQWIEETEPEHAAYWASITLSFEEAIKYFGDEYREA